MSRRLPVALLLVLLAAGTGWAGSQKLKKGQSYADLANAAYRDGELGRLLALHNGLDPMDPPQAGTKLHLPRAKVVRLMIPQRFEDLAWRQLGDDDLGVLIAAVNGRHPKDHPQFRDQVIVPAMLDHTRAPGESLEDVARRFYGSDGAVWPLELANPDPGSELKVPFADFFLEKLNEDEQRLVDTAQRRFHAPRRDVPAPDTNHIAAAEDPKPEPQPLPAEAFLISEVPPEPQAPKPDPEPQVPAPTPEKTEPVVAQAPEKKPAPKPQPKPAAKPPARPAEPAPRAEAREVLAAMSNPLPFAPLEQARQDYEQGYFHRAQTAVTTLLEEESVPQEHRSTAWLLLGLCRVARSEEGEAVDAFRQARRLQPALQLDPFFYPPKVRSAFDRAG